MVVFDSVQKVENIFNKLKETGIVIQELAPQPYAQMYGWIKDKFGIEWQIITNE